jgi:YbgC/YbaW family acyl-CoA thioester hydrolase
MPRLKLDIPEQFNFTTVIPVRITDLNYGGHVGNDTILSLIHEARMQFLKHHGHSELDFGGIGLIMGDVAIEFKNELFYGDQVKASVSIRDISKVSFTLYYKLEKETEGKSRLVALAQTGMVCYDYDRKKMAAFPERVKEQFTKPDHSKSASSPQPE